MNYIIVYIAYKTSEQPFTSWWYGEYIVRISYIFTYSNPFHSILYKIKFYDLMNIITHCVVGCIW